MAETTGRFGLPLIQVGQSQKELTHNEALHKIDALVHLCVESRSVGAPPGNAQIGRHWIVAAGAGGAWAGNDGMLAAWDGSDWRFSTARDGTLCVIADEAILAVHADGAWQADFLPVAGISVSGANMLGAPRTDIAEPVGGSIIDVEARAAIGLLLVYLRLQGVLGG